MLDQKIREPSSETALYLLWKVVPIAPPFGSGVPLGSTETSRNWVPLPA